MKFTIKQIAEATGGEIATGAKTVFEGVGTDSRKIARGQLFVPLRGENFDGHKFIKVALDAGAAGFIYEKAVINTKDAKAMANGKGMSAVAVKDTLYALGEIARSARKRFSKTPLVAITGSTGKSTTKEMTASILAQSANVLKNEGNLNNRVGLPLTLFRLDEKTDVAVVELGTNEPGEIARLAEISAPNVACVTNVGPVHLEGLGSIEGVAKEKGALPAALTRNDTFVANSDDPFVTQMAGNTHARIIAYGISDEKYKDKAMILPAFRYEEFVTAEDIETSLYRSRFTLKTAQDKASVELPIAGRHNVMNAVAAAAIARALNKKTEDIVAGLESFQPLPLRTQTHELPGDVVVIDDCYNSNPLSVSAALDLLVQGGKRTIAVLGEMRELGDAAAQAHERLGDLAAIKGVDILIALGDHAADLVRGFKRQTKKGSAYKVSNAEKAAAKVLAILEPRDTVLLKASRYIHLEHAYPIIKENWTPHSEKKSSPARRASRGRRSGN